MGSFDTNENFDGTEFNINRCDIDDGFSAEVEIKTSYIEVVSIIDFMVEKKIIYINNYSYKNNIHIFKFYISSRRITDMSKLFRNISEYKPGGRNLISDSVILELFISEEGIPGMYSNSTGELICPKI